MKRRFWLIPFFACPASEIPVIRRWHCRRDRFASRGGWTTILLGIASFVMLGLGQVASAEKLAIPDPPRMPQSLTGAPEAEALEGKRSRLLSTKKAWLADVDVFNRATAQEVSEAEGARLQESLKRIHEERTAYLKAIDELRQEIGAALGKVKLASLRGRLHDTQRSLRQLQGQSEVTNEELERWRDVTERTVEHAQDMLADMVTDALLTIPSARLEGMTSEIQSGLSKELQRAASLIAGEADPARRERLEAAFQLLHRQREVVGRVQNLLGNFKQAQETKALDELTQSPEGMQFKTGIQELLLAAGDEKLQQSLQNDFGFSFPVMTKLANGVAGYRYAEKVVGAAYDTTSVLLAWKQIRLQNDSSEKLLQAVDHLGNRVETLVDAINEIKEGTPPR